MEKYRSWNWSLLFALLLIAGCESGQHQDKEYRQQFSLAGEWAFALDSANTGIQDQWYLKDLGEETVKLPGTTDSNQKGFLNTNTTTMHLNRKYRYEGPAWYQKKVTIPEDAEGKIIHLILERTKVTKVWIDSLFVGGSKLLQSPQYFDLTDYLSPGEHILTIRVDNRAELTPYGGTHIYSDDTQTNWNGIIGEIYLEAKPQTWISNLKVYPDIENRKIDIRLETENGLNWEEASITLKIKREEEGAVDYLPVRTIDTTLSKSLALQYDMGEEIRLWDEYQQPLYHLTAVISNGEITDGKTVPFGMRNFGTESTQFTINGRTTFLRGKHDAAIFPNVAHTPTDEADWTRMFEIAKSYGINHVRFHSYTPPEAAFYAADRVGIYLQPELPFWGGLDSDSVAAMQREEGFALLKAFANHPSFVMFSHGNELWSGHDRAEVNIRALKEYDPRPLYTMGSNNSIGYAPPREVSEFFIAARTPSDGDTTLTHTRLTHAFADSRDGGLLNNTKPNTTFDFSYPVSQIDIPLISHEIGQYQIYPDYNEIDKYTGVLEPKNLEVFRNRLKEAGMLDQDSVFQQASGAWSAICYKAEMEAALHTPGMAGFQLLDLQDFSGQGTALVGILDAFMDSKGVVSKEVWKQSCNDVVTMLRLAKFVWTNSEMLTATAEIVNYSQGDFSDAELEWKLVGEDGEDGEDGEVIGEGVLPATDVFQGNVTALAEIEQDLRTVETARRLNLHIQLKGTDYANSYPVWVYPEAAEPVAEGDVMVAGDLDAGTLDALEAGQKVLLFPSDEMKKGNTVDGLFPPDFWNYEMFKGISENNNKPYSPGTLGLLMDPDHPLFNSFPTDFHTNWQWFSIIKNSNPLMLDETPDDYRPTVQVIDNLQRNHKLGLIFEFEVGAGKLLVCMSDLREIADKPEAAQLYRSILNYMNSEEFEPGYEVSAEELQALLR